QILVMSRVRWLERWVGASDLLRWHRWLAAALVTLVPAHIVLITLGYAYADDVSVVTATVDFWTSFGAIISAYIAAGILGAVARISIRSVRRRLPYALWYYLHWSAYLVLLLSYGHQFANGQEVSRGGFGHWYWVGLYAFVVAALAWGRVLLPIFVNARHR